MPLAGAMTSITAAPAGFPGVGKRSGERQRMAHDARADRDPDEREDHDPGGPDGRSAGKRPLQPGPCPSMFRESRWMA